MKLIVIGRDPQEADIVLKSDYVSGYHAELIQLDNGDIILIDKSSNGTTINGIKMTPGKEFIIKRGDEIMFADVPFDWSLVQDLVIPQNIKQVKSIGKHYMNDICLQAPNASRFHATLREMNDGDWYICDHSKNGTSLNGKRIPKNKFVPISYKDEISCAGVPIQNPIPKPSIKYGKIFLILAACVTIGVGIVLLFNINRPISDEKLYQKYSQSTALLLCEYHFEVTCGSLDMSQLPDPDYYNKKKEIYTKRLTDKFVVEGDAIIPYSEDAGNGMAYTATGFFIGNDGNVVTNLHVAKPWLSSTIQTETMSSALTIQSLANDYYRAKLNKLVEQGFTPAIQYISQVEVKGVLDYVILIPNGSYLDEKSAVNCHEVICSDDQEVDLAIFKIKSQTLPVGVTPIPLDEICVDEPTTGRHIYTIGFPYGLNLLDNIEGTKIQANAVGATISRTDNIKTFGFDGVSYSGASGSPIFNEYGQLVGVLYAKVANSQGFNFAVRAKQLKLLIDKAEIVK